MRFLICTQKVDDSDSNLSFFVRWIEEFARHCEWVTVICLQKGEYKLPSNVGVFSLGKPQTANSKQQANPSHSPAVCRLPFTVYKRIHYIFRLLNLVWSEKGNYDAVLVHMNPEYLLVCGWLWKLLGKKVGLWYTHRSTRLLRFALPFVDHVFTPTPDSFPIATKKLMLLSHGIDTEHFKPLHTPSPTSPLAGGGEHPLVILSDTRISRSKHVERTIELSRLLRDAGLAHEIRIVGAAITADDKVYEQELRDRIAKQALPVRFLGGKPYSELPAIYSEADVFINHSNIGALNKVGLQAMAMNLFVLTSNESYGGIIPDAHVVGPEPEAFRDGILAYAKGRSPVTYRDVILEHHSLQKLIPRICATYTRQ